MLGHSPRLLNRTQEEVRPARLIYVAGRLQLEEPGEQSGKVEPTAPEEAPIRLSTEKPEWTAAVYLGLNSDLNLAPSCHVQGPFVSPFGPVHFQILASPELAFDLCFKYESVGFKKQCDPGSTRFLHFAHAKLPVPVPENIANARQVRKIREAQLTNGIVDMVAEQPWPQSVDRAVGVGGWGLWGCRVVGLVCVCVCVCLLPVCLFVCVCVCVCVGGWVVYLEKWPICAARFLDRKNFAYAFCGFRGSGSWRRLGQRVSLDAASLLGLAVSKLRFVK